MMVKGFWGALRIDLQRAFRLPFWLCSIWIAAIHIHSVWLSMVDAYGSVVAVYNEAVTVENYMQGLIPVLVSTVFSTAFLDDYQSEYYRFHLLRSNRTQYIGAKLSVCAISAFLCMWLGLALFLLAARIRFPLFSAEDIERSLNIGYALNGCALLQAGHPFMYLLTAITLRSIAMMLWPLCAMAVSVYVSNRFVVLGAPWLLDYAIGAFESIALQIPYGKRFLEFTTGSASFADPIMAWGQLLIRYIPSITLCAVLFFVGAQRRLKNG